jgi:hypothetical protein
MRKVINGKTYNTEAATELGSDDRNELRMDDFCFFQETLYRSRTGNYFLYGIGGARTRFGIRVSDHWVNADEYRIIPLSEDEAVHWCIASGNLKPLKTYLAKAYKRYFEALREYREHDDEN